MMKWLRNVAALTLVLLGGVAAVAAAEAPAAAEEAVHGLPQAAVPLFNLGPLAVTNSMLLSWVVALGVIGFAQLATRRMERVPGGLQNVAEWVVESLNTFLADILGPGLASRGFWFFATIFIVILANNWVGLIPGVGTIGMGQRTASGQFEVTEPFLRGGNADLNLTSAMAMLFFACWLVWAFQANGVKGFLLEIFGPKGDATGFIKGMMVVVFFLVGFLELISITFRPVALMFRLYGNIFAGENLLEAMGSLVQHPAWAKALASVALPIPFYLLEVLVGFVQALVFMLLCAVFTAVICTHEEESGKGHHEHA